MERQDVILDEHIYTDINGKEHTVYPMKLKYTSRVNRLLLKMNMDYLYLNLPVAKTDKDGNYILDTDGEVIYNTSSYDAMMEVFKIALNEPIEEIEEWVDLRNGAEIIEMFLQVGSLKKNIQQKMMEEALLRLSQQ